MLRRKTHSIRRKQKFKGQLTRIITKSALTGSQKPATILFKLSQIHQVPNISQNAERELLGRLEQTERCGTPT